MRSDYTKQNKSKYRDLERKYEAMTVNRQVNYGYRGTTPNYVMDLPKEPVPRNNGKR